MVGDRRGHPLRRAAREAEPGDADLALRGVRPGEPEERAGIYRDIQQLVVTDAPWINLYTSSTFEGLRDTVDWFRANTTWWRRVQDGAYRESSEMISSWGAPTAGEA